MSGADALREAWRAGRPTFGGWCSTGSPLAAELLALAGFDWVTLDLQHGLAGLDQAAGVFQAISAAGAVPLARVPGNEHWLIGRVLDLGAAGAIVPLVSTPEQAVQAVRATRYPPDGARSMGPVRTGGTAAPPLCIPMVETRGAIEQLEAILATPGIDGVYVGPRDLALDHGLARGGPEVDVLVDGVADACRAAGVPAGIHAGSGEEARARVEGGYVFAAVASDRDLLVHAARAELAAAYGGEAPPPRSPPEGLLRAASSYLSL